MAEISVTVTSRWRDLPMLPEPSLWVSDGRCNGRHFTIRIDGRGLQLYSDGGLPQVITLVELADAWMAALEHSEEEGGTP